MTGHDYLTIYIGVAGFWLRGPRPTGLTPSLNPQMFRASQRAAPPLGGTAPWVYFDLFIGVEEPSEGLQSAC
jgi:hypothetical protein